ncbi:MAG: FIST N-terminal domain-containing protein, partial [Methanoregula sp.]|nr:FIST N-terminal domain-containing protein [Methanoregula sp.]
MKAGAAYSGLDDSVRAGKEAAENAVKASGKPAVTFLFTTDNYEQEAVYHAVKDTIGESCLIGICAGGIIFGDKLYRKGIGVLTLAGEEIRVATSFQAGLSHDPYLAGERAGEELFASGIESGTVFVFPDGFSANIAETIRGLYNKLGPGYRYVGGGAGDNLKFFKTYQFSERGIGTDSLSVALVGGIDLGTAIGHGWKPVGDPLIITMAKGKKVLEIDGRPAFDAYAERFTEITADGFPEYGMKYPLGFPDISGNYFIRDPLSLNLDKTIDFVTEVPNNAVGSIMQGQVEELIEVSGTVAGNAASGMANPQFALVCECVS